MSNSSTPAALGYRWPAEWEPHRATWLSWPHNPQTWPGKLDLAVDAFVAIAAALAERELLCINVCDEAMEERARAALRAGGVDPDRSIEFHRIPTDDAWARDYGPLFVVRGSEGGGKRAVLDFGFDNWGKKYPRWERDAAVAGRVAAELGLPCFRSDWVLEGGAIDGNGAGSVLTTESCLLNPNRGANRSRQRMERLLREFLGAEQILWLAGGLEGDDTDGHVDDVARFVDVSTVITVVCEDPADANHVPTRENLRRLERMLDARGRSLDVVPLPSPPPRRVGGLRCPESYANFYLANGAALVPTFGVPSDARALAVLRELLPERTVIGIPCSDLVLGLGAVHCLTQQEPL